MRPTGERAYLVKTSDGEVVAPTWRVLRRDERSELVERDLWTELNRCDPICESEDEEQADDEHRAPALTLWVDEVARARIPLGSRTPRHVFGRLPVRTGRAFLESMKAGKTQAQTRRHIDNTAKSVRAYLEHHHGDLN